MSRKPKPHSETAWMPMNDGRVRRSKKPFFAPAFGGLTKRESREQFSPDDDDWKLHRKYGWRIVKVRISVMTAGQIKAEKGTRR